ncbi:hypothetical protein [Microvirga brassicacearum]|uniref:Uncharacterized protein n=1 Tax=Microvirga brassicacearum TaxID=2580413 RepID=A0A5N3PA56_9HYPH|nr:hypothetical protein [Microvirga brassicacearum]KAB0266593.1 hypothetical protein FEZ63_13220 [Microvirga brassicacearum]
MSLPWKRSREADLWLRLNPAKALRVLAQGHGQAGEEALLRAWLAERDGRREAVLFWLRVYEASRGRQENAAAAE